MIFKNILKYCVEKIFFKRRRSVLFCVVFSVLSYFIENKFCLENFFSSSGSVFTIAGLFLNIKLTAHYHLKLPNGEPLGVASKYAMIAGCGIFGNNNSLEEKAKKVKEVEDDELWGQHLWCWGH